MIYLITGFAELLGTALTVMATVTTVYMAVLYVLYSVAIHRLARARGMQNTWLAFVPAFRLYTLGAVTDEIRSAAGKTGRSRLTLLWLSLAAAGIALAASGSGSEEAAESGEAFAVLLFLVLMVVETVALRHIVREYRPESVGLSTVLCAIPMIRSIAKVVVLWTVSKQAALHHRGPAAASGYGQLPGPPPGF